MSIDKVYNNIYSHSNYLFLNEVKYYINKIYNTKLDIKEFPYYACRFNIFGDTSYSSDYTDFKCVFFRKGEYSNISSQTTYFKVGNVNGSDKFEFYLLSYIIDDRFSTIPSSIFKRYYTGSSQSFDYVINGELRYDLFFTNVPFSSASDSNLENNYSPFLYYIDLLNFDVNNGYSTTTSTTSPGGEVGGVDLSTTNILITCCFALLVLLFIADFIRRCFKKR